MYIIEKKIYILKYAIIFLICNINHSDRKKTLCQRLQKLYFPQSSHMYIKKIIQSNLFKFTTASFISLTSSYRRTLKSNRNWLLVLYKLNMFQNNSATHYWIYFSVFNLNVRDLNDFHKNNTHCKILHLLIENCLCVQIQ